jgi:energy-coupling factor transport system ATP-binding protein
MIVMDRVSYVYPFQPQAAVSGFSLRVDPGEAMLITGASGCGKSTIIRLINGLCPHFFKGRLTGSIAVNGKDSLTRRLDEIALDAGTLFQDPEHQFFATSVEDEIAFVHEWREFSPLAVRRKVDRAAEQFALGPLLHQSILCLSEGEKQKVALAGIISLDPRALVLDEPTANLDPESTLDLARMIMDLKRQGMAIVIVDHRLYWLESVVDRVIVMEKGRSKAEGGFSILDDSALRERFGLRQSRVEDKRADLTPVTGKDPDVDVEDLCFRYGSGPDLFCRASFSLFRGVTGLLGKNGTGKTTLARLLTGLTRVDQGRFQIRGTAVTPGQLLERAGIVLQNTDHQLHMQTVRDELVLSTDTCRQLKTGPDIDAVLDLFGLDGLSPRHPQSLSGGEKQRLVIACAMIRQPDILILDEPTSGLDGKNLHLIAGAIRRAADHGTCVLLISHDLELISRCCDGALHLPLKPFIHKETDHV